MHYFIDLSRQQKSLLWAHLLPQGAIHESAAFLFARVVVAEQATVLVAEDLLLVERSGFKVQLDDYIELTDEARIAIIKKAHQTGAVLIELHSHPFDGPWAAAFSLADMRGFEETVPHMWWRLPGRPYAAVVVAPAGFDSIVWFKDPRSPECLTALRVDSEPLYPSRLTLGEKK